MIYGMNILLNEASNEIPVPKEGYYLYLFADDDELERIAEFSPELAAKFEYTYMSDGYHYCNVTPQMLTDYADIFEVLLFSGLLNYNYFMKSNRPGYPKTP